MSGLVSRYWKRLVRWLAAEELHVVRTSAYLRGFSEGRETAPMTCGVPARDHCPHDYMDDPGQ